MADATGRPFHARKLTPVGGGCITRCYRLEGDPGNYFVLLNRVDAALMFEAEAAGLRELAGSETVAVPQPVCWGRVGGQACLVLQWLELSPPGGAAEQELGRQLAALHAIRRPHFGWHGDNAIGSTFQPNRPEDDWVVFWASQRLGHQLNLAARQGYGGPLQRDGERLRSELGGLFRGYRPLPALLHGDLWAGNWAQLANGQPVIFDPACYYGDREADLAMTELFGGFGSGFYAAYRQAFPLDAGYSVRKNLYNLYHILNHLNLFGAGYLHQAQTLLAGLLAELKA
ncbi:MAG: fructosamine kinase family protein [Methylococcaceae bacterium]|nr:fructosamine kinase family protein [Methylococcaceae bacterium]